MILEHRDCCLRGCARCLIGPWALLGHAKEQHCDWNPLRPIAHLTFLRLLPPIRDLLPTSRQVVPTEADPRSLPLLRRCQMRIDALADQSDAAWLKTNDLVVPKESWVGLWMYCPLRFGDDSVLTLVLVRALPYLFVDQVVPGS